MQYLGPYISVNHGLGGDSCLFLCGPTVSVSCALHFLVFVRRCFSQQGSLCVLLGLLKRISYACTSAREYIKLIYKTVGLSITTFTAFCFRNSSCSNLYCASSCSRKFFSRQRIRYILDVSICYKKQI